MTETDYSEALAYPITEEDIERARELIGLDEPCREREYVATASVDNIRSFALGIGNDNPLFCDPDHAGGTRWGSVIAPTMMAGIINKPMRGEVNPEIKRLKRGLFKGVHVFMSGSTWDFYRPIFPGDSLYSFRGEETVDVKESEFAGKTLIRTRHDVKVNQRSEVVAIYRSLWVLAERKASAKNKKYTTVEPAKYSEEQFAEIERVYNEETMRGGVQRRFEDVCVGDRLPLAVRGPLTVTDMLCFHAGGYGFVPYNVSAGRVAHKNRKRIPAFYIKNEQGIPDVAQRVHWDNDWAKGIGNPMAYDYGILRENYIYSYLADWCGDDGIIVKMHDEVRKFNYMGDVQYISGEITGTRIEDGAGLIDLEVRLINQRDEETVMATATIVLPTAERPALYPDVPRDRQARAVLMMSAHWAAEKAAGRSL